MEGEAAEAASYISGSSVQLRKRIEKRERKR